jgi:hypothetical protein
MIELHYWPMPNGWKITIMLEECGLPYRSVPVRIGRGEQFRPEFLAPSPNNRIPAIVDHAPADDGAPISIFESGVPWIMTHKAQGIAIGSFPHVKRRFTALRARKALQRGLAVGRELREMATRGPDEEARRFLFGQTATTAR